MKYTLSIIASFLFVSSIFSQNADGYWYGVLDVYGQKLPLVVNIDTANNSGTMDSPKQQMFGTELENISLSKTELKFEISQLKLSYKAKIGKDTLIGVFTQAGAVFKLNFGKSSEIIKYQPKPQEPQKPYPYFTEDVQFRNNNDAIELSGTFTRPAEKGLFPAVILVSGSGPNNRNEEILGHKPFLVIADYLTKKGIAVLRYDDRGVGKSNGDHDIATSEDFKNDAIAAVEYLLTRNDVDPNKIGVIGHSEGGLIATMLAAEEGAVVDFIISLAGTAVPGDSILLMQQGLILEQNGVTETVRTKLRNIERGAYNIIKNNSDGSSLSQKLSVYYGNAYPNYPRILMGSMATKQEFVEAKVSVIDNPWMRYFIRYNPKDVMENIDCAVLALNGSKDLQVPPKENLAVFTKSNTNGNITVKELQGLNHLFQTSSTGNPAEYGVLEETFSPKALKIMSDWILKL